MLCPAPLKLEALGLLTRRIRYTLAEMYLHKYPAVQERDDLTRLSLGCYQVTIFPVT